MSSINRPSGRRPHRAVGIKDIARALGVSTGTVDRALHAKPGINPLTRARVLRTAESLGYRPNLAARHLKSPRRWRVVVQLPEQIALFWDSLRDGIRDAAALFEPTLQVEFQNYPRLGQGDVEVFEAALADESNAFIVAPGNPAALRPWIRKAAQKGLPVVCVVTDAPDTQRLTSVSADPFTVGAVAGELLCRCLPPGGPVAFFTGWLGTQDHAEKLRGFETSLGAAGRAPTLAAVVEAHDDEQEGRRRTIELVESHADLKGIYVSTVNSLPVVRTLEEMGRLRDLTVVTTDLFPELAGWIRDGKVSATVYQRPASQGRLALEALYQFLLYGTCPPPRIKVVPHLVMRSNLDLFLERLGVDLDGAGEEGLPPPGRVGAPAASRRSAGRERGSLLR